MKYEVYVGNKHLYGVTSVDFSNDRDVSICEGVGQGKFTVPGSAGIGSWSIKCELTEEKQNYHNREWSNAGKMLKSLQSLLDSKEPTRLIVRADFGRTSKTVLLKGIDRSESYAGVYEVTLKFVEYQKVTSLSEDVPPITRPGRIPIVQQTAPAAPGYQGSASGSQEGPTGPLKGRNPNKGKADICCVLYGNVKRTEKDIQEIRNNPAVFDFEYGVAIDPATRAELERLYQKKREEMTRYQFEVSKKQQGDMKIIMESQTIGMGG